MILSTGDKACCIFAARAAARRRATLSLGVSFSMLVEEGVLRRVGGWYVNEDDEVPADEGFEDAWGEVDVKRVKVSEGGIDIASFASFLFLGRWPCLVIGQGRTSIAQCSCQMKIGGWSWLFVSLR